MATIMSDKSAALKPILQATQPPMLTYQSTLATLRDKVKTARRRLRDCNKKRDKKNWRKYKQALERAIGRYNDEKEAQSGKEHRLVACGPNQHSDDEDSDEEVFAKPNKKDKSKKSKKSK